MYILLLPIVWYDTLVQGLLVEVGDSRSYLRGTFFEEPGGFSIPGVVISMRFRPNRINTQFTVTG